MGDVKQPIDSSFTPSRVPLKGKVLIVDDDQAGLSALESMLDGLVGDVKCVNSGKEALKYLLTENVALILLDVKMPIMDGFETAGLIREREKSRTTPIIFLTAYDKDEISQLKGYSIGASDFLVKPIVPAILQSRVKVFIDLDQNRRTIEELNEELGRMNRELIQFAFVASHDLQTPLRHITSYVQKLANKVKPIEGTEEFRWIKYILDGTSRMKDLINDLLVFSRVGNSSLTFTSVDLNRVVKAVLDSLAIKIEETNAEVLISNLPNVTGDAGRLGQLIQNLLENALKFKNEQRPLKIEIGAEVIPGFTQFWIKDNGIGISSEQYQRVFEIFQKLHSRENYSGTGIGLAVCKKVVELHGGKIWIDSKPDEGTTFFFTLANNLFDKEIKIGK